MAGLNDDAIFTAARGFVLVAPVGTAGPDVEDIAAFDETTLPAGWALIGHTSAEELPEFGFDGGDTEVRGSWQNAQLKTVQTETLVDYMTMNVMQFDADTFELYYGEANTDSSTPGVFQVVTNETEGADRALAVVMVDGDFKIGFHAPKANLRRDEAISLETDSYAYMPIRATFLKEPGKPLYEWIVPSLVQESSSSEA